MGAIVKPAVLGNLKNFGKEMCHFVGIEIDSSEALYARSVDNVPTLWQRVHLLKSGRVHAFVVRSGYGSDFYMSIR